MKFEERVTVLCAQALAADDDAQVRKILAELRLVLRQRIEQLRSGLLAAYTSSLIRPESVGHEPGIAPPIGAPMSPEAADAKNKTWQRIVHAIACETEHGRALQLSQELSGFLQRHAESPGQG